MRPLRIACIVEGHGDAVAVPILIRRIAADLDPAIVVIVDPVIRVPRSRLVLGGGIEAAVELAARRIPAGGGILVLVDADDDCPAQLGPRLLGRASDTRSDICIGVVLARAEFEAWFLATAESIRGRRGLATDIITPPDPEAIRDAKKWLRDHMIGNATYAEPADQPALTAVFDLERARQGSPSFDKCFREVTRLIDTIRSVSKGDPLD